MWNIEIGVLKKEGKKCKATFKGSKGVLINDEKLLVNDVQKMILRDGEHGSLPGCRSVHTVFNLRWQTT